MIAAAKSMMQFRVEFRVGRTWREDYKVCATKAGAVRRATQLERRRDIDTRIVTV